MAKVIDDNFMVCADCLPVIANGDYTSLDYYYPGAQSGKRAREINAGLDNAGGYVVAGDSDKDLEYSFSTCDCCGNSLAGSRHHCVVLE